MKKIDFEAVTSPIWADEGHTTITAQVKFSHLPEAVPFAAGASDPEQHGRELHAALISGQFGPIAAHVTATIEETRANMPALTARQLRLALLLIGKTPDDVLEIIKAMPAGMEREASLVEWEYASLFRRTHALIDFVGGALNLSSKQIDELWVAAAAL